MTYNPNRTKYSRNITLSSTVPYDGIECTVNTIGEDALKNCTGLTSITVYD